MVRSTRSGERKSCIRTMRMRSLTGLEQLGQPVVARRLGQAHVEVLVEQHERRVGARSSSARSRAAAQSSRSGSSAVVVVGGSPLGRAAQRQQLEARRRTS